MHTTVLGASGGIGRAVALELVDRGHDVTGSNRAGDVDLPGVTPLAADLLDAAEARRACAGADVVVLAAQPPYPRWLADWPPMLEHVLAGCAASGARLVLTDNLYAHAPATGPLTEASPEHATDAKGVLRRRLAERLRAAHDAGEVATAIGRFSDYYGPGGTNSGLYMLGIEPALRGRRPRGLVDLDQPHTFHYLPDTARGFATLVEQDAAYGRTWMLPAAPATTQRELLGLVQRAVHGHGARGPGRITPAMLRIAGLFDPLVRETRSVVVQYDRPWVTDPTAFTDAFGPVEVTPHAQAVEATVAWFRTQVPTAVAA